MGSGRARIRFSLVARHLTRMMSQRRTLVVSHVRTFGLSDLHHAGVSPASQDCTNKTFISIVPPSAARGFRGMFLEPPKGHRWIPGASIRWAPSQLRSRTPCPVALRSGIAINMHLQARRSIQGLIQGSSRARGPVLHLSAIANMRAPLCVLGIHDPGR